MSEKQLKLRDKLGLLDQLYTMARLCDMEYEQNADPEDLLVSGNARGRLSHYVDLFLLSVGEIHPLVIIPT